MLIVYSNFENLPIANDDWHFVSNPSNKMKNVGRWTNFLFYQYKHLVDFRLGLLFDFVSFNLLGYYLISPIAKRVGFTAQVFLLMYWCTSTALIGFAGYPGAITIANVIATVLVILLLRAKAHLARLAIYIIGGILMFGSYEVYYFITIFPYLLKILNEPWNTTDILRELIFWIVGFFIGWLSWQGIHYLIYDQFIHTRNSYRTLLHSNGGSAFERIGAIFYQVKERLFFNSFRGSFLNNLLQILIIIKVFLGSWHLGSINKKWLGVYLVPALGLLLALSVNNHNFFDRMSLPIHSTLVIFMAFALFQQFLNLRIPLVILGIIVAIASLSARKVIFEKKARVTSSTASILSYLPDGYKDMKKSLLIYLDKQDRSCLDGIRHSKLLGGVSHYLGLKKIRLCFDSKGYACRQIKTLDLEQDTLCSINCKYIGNTEDFHFLKIGKIQDLCK